MLPVPAGGSIAICSARSEGTGAGVAAYATVERVDRIQEDLDAIAGTVAEVLDEQRWVKANLRALLGHFGIPEVTAPADPDDA